MIQILKNGFIMYLFFFLGTFILDSNKTKLQQTVVRKQRVLVSIAIWWWPSKSPDHIFRILEEYDASFFSSGYDVQVRLDTNDPSLITTLSIRQPSHIILEIRSWTMEELGGDPEYLIHIHRHFWEEHARDFDFFIFNEDDVLFQIDSFNFYVNERIYLQDRGWTFGWVIVETWGIDNKTLVAIDQVYTPSTITVFETLDGKLWAEPWSPYSAFYILDRDELQRMIEDPSYVWSQGFPPWDTRTKISAGYSFKFSGNGLSIPYGARGWQSRALIPISRSCEVDHLHGIVHHLPSKYAKNTVLAKSNECIEGLSSTDSCGFGTIPLSRTFICERLEPIPLTFWPVGANLGKCRGFCK